MINSTFFANLLRAGSLRPLVFGWTICFWLFPQLGLGQAGRDEVLEGNSLFAEGRFDEAHEKYEQALEEDPSSAAIRFNLGDAEYKKSLYEEAIEGFSQAMQTEDPELQASASYNLGNALYRLGKLEDSIQAYQDALRINPEDRDSKHNLEFVRSKLEEQEQKKEEDQDRQDQDQKDQDQSRMRTEVRIRTKKASRNNSRNQRTRSRPPRKISPSSRIRAKGRLSSNSRIQVPKR